MDAETKAYFERINKKLSLLIDQKNTQTWVSVSWVVDLTGWDNQRMRMAREQGIVKFKKADTGGYLYLIESIPKLFLKNYYDNGSKVGENREASKGSH
ncbi:hypothetical protein [Flavitalea sp.]|nr:hypothetical protein [Flavitalea sp.]